MYYPTSSSHVFVDYQKIDQDQQQELKASRLVEDQSNHILQLQKKILELQAENNALRKQNLEFQQRLDIWKDDSMKKSLVGYQGPEGVGNPEELRSEYNIILRRELAEERERCRKLEIQLRKYELIFIHSDQQMRDVTRSVNEDLIDFNNKPQIGDIAAIRNPYYYHTDS